MSRRSQHRIPSSERGSALLVAMCFTLVLAVALASYQTACYYTLKTGSRNMQTLRSRQLAETGLEEALWALNNRTFTGWTISGGVYTKSLTGFTYESAAVTGQVNLTITNYDDTNRNTTKPTITSVGIVQNTDGTTVKRTLSASTGYSSAATTGRAPILANAMAASSTSGTVNLTSGGLTVDSYNSSVGLYNSATNAGYSAIVSGNSVTLANGSTVKGYVVTPPNSSGNVVLSAGATAKLKGPSTSASLNIDTTRQSTSPNQIITDVPTPSGAGTSLTEPSSGTVHLGTAGATTPAVYYATNNDTLYGYGSGWYVLGAGTLSIDGPVTIIVSGNFYINGSGSIVISSAAGSNASLQLLVAGSAYIYYNGIDNQTKLPKNLAIIGTGTYTGNAVQFWTPTKFYGAVYAPKTDIYLYGYSSASEFFGSFVGNNVTVYPYSSTALPIHYDVALRNAVFSGVGDTAPYAVSNVTDTFP